MSKIETRIKKALEKSRASDKPGEWVSVTFSARLGPDGALEISEPAVRTPWIPLKSKS